jgi:hypothetical protein
MSMGLSHLVLPTPSSMPQVSSRHFEASTFQHLSRPSQQPDIPDIEPSSTWVLVAPTRSTHIFYPIFYSPTSSPTLSYYTIAGCRLHFAPPSRHSFFPWAWPLANLEFQFLRPKQPVVCPWHFPMSH